MASASAKPQAPRPPKRSEAQKRKRLDLEAKASGLAVHDPEEEQKDDFLPLPTVILFFWMST
jgi:hypothetical protein